MKQSPGKSFFVYFVVLTFILVLDVCVADAEPGPFEANYSKYAELTEAGKYTQAVEFARLAYEQGLELYGESNINSAVLTFNYGDALLKVYEPAEARPILKTALKRYESAYGTEAIELIDPLMGLGQANEVGPCCPGAKKYFNRALAIAESYEGVDSELYGDLSLEAGRELLEHLKIRDAQIYLLMAHSVFEQRLGADHPKTGVADFALGKVALYEKDYAAAEGFFMAALNTFEFPDQPSNPFELSTHAVLVEVYERMDESDKATAHCQAIGRMTPYQPDQEFEPIFRVPPQYPMKELRSGKRGEAVVEFTVSEYGIVTNPEVVESDGSGFSRATLEAIGQFRFAPRFVDGQPVATEGVRQRMTFEISR